ncbi:UNVERIFIED_CONTAM: hypothetical protein Sindi_2650500 [Sesamum indicum]
MNSIGIFKTGLDRFAEWSGLRLNVQKSHLIISRSAQGLREEMLAALGFQEGVLPMKYLGLPLLSSRLTIADCRRLLLKIDKRYCWLGSLYWASTFILPKKVTNEIEKKLRTFLWKGTTTSGYAKITHRWCYTGTANNNMEQIWQHNIIGAPMYAVTRKLKALKPVFREQRRNKGDLSHNVQLAKGFLEMAQLLWMKGGDQCSRVFFRKIAQQRSARRILQINDDHGATHTEPQEVVNEFVMYYQNLLGGEQRRDVIDLRFPRPWVRHLLSEEDVNSLLLPFTPADVKQAVFDIAEDKAPGPDGYSSGFFKAAWPIVGQEVTSAVLDFFNTG